MTPKFRHSKTLGKFVAFFFAYKFTKCKNNFKTNNYQMINLIKTKKNNNKI